MMVRPAGLLRVLAVIVAAALNAQPATAQLVRIGQLNDIAFGTLTTAGADRVLTDNLCVYTSSATGRYRVTATGTSSGSTFMMTSGGNQLPIELQWAFSANQTSGTPLLPSTAVAGTTGNTNNFTCNGQPSASLIVILRAAQNGSARAGSYSGSVSIRIAPN